MSKPLEKWYLLRNGQKTGPYTRKQLAWYIRQGLIDADSLLWKESLPDWIEAEEVPGLFPEKKSSDISPDVVKQQQPGKYKLPHQGGGKKSRKKIIPLLGALVIVALLLFFLSGTGSSPVPGDALPGFVLRVFPALADYAPSADTAATGEPQQDDNSFAPVEDPELPPEEQDPDASDKLSPGDENDEGRSPEGLMIGDFETIIGSWKQVDDRGSLLYYRFAGDGIVQVVTPDTGCWGQAPYRLQEETRFIYLLSFYNEPDDTWEDIALVEPDDHDRLVFRSIESREVIAELQEIGDREFSIFAMHVKNQHCSS